MTNPKWEEIILAAPRVDIFENETLAFQGTLTEQAGVDRIMENVAESFVAIRRGNDKDETEAENNAEINVALKQPIPYAVIRRGEEIFVYERLQGGGESRLFNKLSLGAGGHMNPVEGVEDFAEVLAINLQRELEEELDIEDKDMELTSIGLINDDSEPVSQVHLGVLVIIDVAKGTEVTVRETDQLLGFWMNLERLREPGYYDRLENWSQIVIDLLS